MLYSDTDLLEVNNHAISISFSDEYVIFKESSYAGIYLMPICTPYERYDVNTATCNACSVDRRTEGLQHDTCMSCNEFYLDYDTDFGEALYEQVCSEGTIKSIAISVALPILVGMLALVCCCVDYNKDRKYMKEQEEQKKTREEDEIKKLNSELELIDT